MNFAPPSCHALEAAPRAPQGTGAGRSLGLLALVLIMLMLSGCDTLRSMTPWAKKAEATKAEYQQLQARNMRFADEYAGRLIEAARIARPTLVDAKQRELMADWMLGQVNAAYIAATGENPVVATLDLLTLTVLSRMVLEESIAKRFPEQTAALLDAQRNLEEQAWELGNQFLTDEQKKTLRSLYAQWLKSNPSYNSVAFVRFQDFVGADGGPDTTGGVPTGSLFALVGLDPLSGLDPAVKQVELSRLLAERAVFYAQRVPVLVDLQLERSLTRLAAGPDMQRLQQQSASFTQSVEKFATLAQALPQLLASEREAFISQVSSALIDQQATLKPLLAELKGTMAAGTSMADAVDQATRSLDAFVARFAKKPGDPADTGKPFDINEYTQAALAIERGSAQLQQLFGALGAGAPAIDSSLNAAVDTNLRKGEALVDFLFWRIVWLILLLSVAVLLVLAVHHMLARRRPALTPSAAGSA